MTDALEVLRQKRAELGTAAVAEALEVSVSTIRSICTGNYPGNPDRVLKRVARRWIDVVACPVALDFGRQQIGRDECRARATAPQPFGGEVRLKWWKTCQTCPNRPDALTPNPNKKEGV